MKVLEVFRLISQRSLLIVAHGESPSHALAQRMAATHQAVLATDGAIRVANALGLNVDYLSGDLDSVTPEELTQRAEGVLLIPTPDQERADLEKAILEAQHLGFESITVLGALGRRPDHTIANLALLLALPPEPTVVYADDYGFTRAISANGGVRSVAIVAEPGDTISLVAMATGVVVSAAGVEWPLHEEELLPGTRGVSNRAADSVVTITVHSGALFLIHLNRIATG